MNHIAPKSAFQKLIADAVSTGVASGWTLDNLRGIALYNPLRDAPLISLNAFAEAAETLVAVSNFIATFGAAQEARAVLQFIYQYFARMDEVRYDEAVFDGLWCDFTAEVHDAYWVVRGVANVRNFQSDRLLLDLGDGVTIRGRIPEDLATLGFGPAIWDRIVEDWGSTGASSFVLVAEHFFFKRPSNLVDLNSYAVWEKARRAIQALRLADAGSISIGPMWTVRAARFNVGIGGVTSVGASIPASGSFFQWTEKVGKLYGHIYRSLATLEKEGYRRSPGNLEIALRAFMATYDRWPSHTDYQLLDSITALEALLGSESEIAFKLSFRVASLLASNDTERATLLTLLKQFYDCRSRVVHGAQLSEKQKGRLAGVDELRAIVRQLLRSFVTFAIDPVDSYGKTFFKERLDVALVDATERDKVRSALDLDKP